MERPGYWTLSSKELLKNQDQRRAEIKQALIDLYRDLGCAERHANLTGPEIRREYKAGRFPFSFDQIMGAFGHKLTDAFEAAGVPYTKPEKKPKK